MDRGRDRRFDDRAMGGETYRPTDRARSPPRGNTYRANRSPPRRAHTPPYVDTYAPGGGRPRSRSPRRRSRSPAYRGRNEGAYRGRPRSPPRAFSPRKDVNGRSSPPRVRRYSRSPPPVKRRDPSPINSRRPRSPPPYVKQERYVSPGRERYERRAYSPPRDRAPRYPQETSYRPKERSRSPVRRVEQTSRIASPDSSHRSTPQIHPDRLAAVTGSGTHSPAYRNNLAPPAARSPSYRERSPPRRAYSPVPVSPPPREREPAPYRQRTPPRRQSPPYAKQDHREEYRNGGSHSAHDNSMSAPVNGNLQNGNRGPPSGPGSSYRDSPSGPPSAPLSMSAHSRAPPPFRPRGGPSSYNREPRDPSFQGGPPPRRGGYGQGPPPSPYSRGSSNRGHYDPGPPNGPRTGGGYSEHRSSLPFNLPPFRPNNSSSTTYPRTQRFNNPAPANTQPKIENHSSLAGMPSIVPGGKAAPSGLDPAAERRLQQLEDDKKKLEEMIAEKQRIKRQSLRDWETKERESARDGLRSELAEQSLEKMGMGESNTGAAF